VAAGGAIGAGYVYVRGEVDRDYPATYPDVRAAVLASLKDLGMPLLKERYSTDNTTIESRTLNDESVEIALTTRTSKIPAEGPVTRVSIRVATWGDHAVSNRLLDQVGMHLAPVAVAGVPRPTQPGPAVVPASLPLTPVPASGQPGETAPPPLVKP
jgi:hypothetical protein